MRVAISGSSGLIGTALAEALRADDHQVIRLVRSPAGTPTGASDAVTWDPTGATIDARALERLDAVVHLAEAFDTGP